MFADWNPYFDACAPEVGNTTLAAIVQVESGGHPFAMLDNGPANIPYPARLRHSKSYKFKTKEEAVATASRLLGQGRLLDMGLMQVNSNNMRRMGLSVADMFDPCTNIKTGAKILTDNYERAASKYGPGQKALQHALSAYNTGSMYRGAGYVEKILAAAGASGSMALGAPPATNYSRTSAGSVPRSTSEGPDPHKAGGLVKWLAGTSAPAPSEPTTPYRSGALVRWESSTGSSTWR